MGKLTTYVIMMSGIYLLFYIGGLTPESPFLTLLLNPQNILNVSFFNQILAAITAIGIGVVVVGLFTRNTELAAKVGISIFILTLLFDFIAVANVVRNENPVLALLLMSPLFIMLGITGVEWWTGRD